MARCDLRHCDGVLAHGEIIRRLYVDRGWAARAWTWHEAADVRRFGPQPAVTAERDLAWVGNWGDEERTAQLQAFLVEPVRALRLSAHARHTCSHRVDALLSICAELDGRPRAVAAAPPAPRPWRCPGGSGLDTGRPSGHTPGPLNRPPG